MIDDAKVRRGPRPAEPFVDDVSLWGHLGPPACCGPHFTPSGGSAKLVDGTACQPDCPKLPFHGKIT
jgi:hypothetical protein